MLQLDRHKEVQQLQERIGVTSASSWVPAKWAQRLMEETRRTKGAMLGAASGRSRSYRAEPGGGREDRGPRPGG